MTTVVVIPVVQQVVIEPDQQVVTITTNQLQLVEVGTQGPPGPPGTGNSAEVMTLTNGDGVSHQIGDAVYFSGSDIVRLARADTINTANVVAVAQGTVAPGATGNYQSAGLLPGLVNLTTDAVYFLSATTAGAITTTPPSTVGQVVVEIGIAASRTELLIRPRLAILL